MTKTHRFLLPRLRRLQQSILESVRTNLSERFDDLSEVSVESPSDTIYRIDTDTDSIVLRSLKETAEEVPLLVISEGISDEGAIALPEGTPPEKCPYRVILDPIDGTRMIMYDKRSAWSLAAVAPNRGEGTNLQDVEMAVMTEIPTSKQRMSDVVWARRGSEVGGFRENHADGSRRGWRPSPSQSSDLDHGFAQFSKFFPGEKSLIAELEEKILEGMGSFRDRDRIRVFDDQYLSTGGQIYELIAGRDRFQADVRGAIRKMNRGGGSPPGIAAHPYDICVELIARQAGVVITDLSGEPLRCPLDTTSEVDWLGFANEELFRTMFPVVESVLREARLID